MNVLAQVFAIIALIIMFCSYQKKSKKDFLFLQIFMNIFFGLQYFLLNAYSALASNIVSIIRTGTFYRFEKYDKKIPATLLVLFVILILGLGIATYNGISSIIPIVIAVFYTYGTWQKKLMNTYKIGVLAAILWIYYNFSVGAYASVIGSVFELISSLLGLIKFKNNTTKIQKNVDKPKKMC